MPTSIGQLAAYDPAASAICGDMNSLCFGEDGTVSSLVTAACSLRWQQGKEQKCMSPRMEKDQLTMLRTVVVPLRVEFLPNGLVRMDDGKQIMQAPSQGITVGPFVALPDMRESR